MATDWVALRLEYVHGTGTLRELANKHGIKAAGVMTRSANEDWETARKQHQASTSKAADAVMGEERVTRLARFNDDDVKIAEALKGRAAAMLKSPALSATELRAVSAVFDTAQQIGRLALGASTENNAMTVTTPKTLDEFYGKIGQSG